MEKIKDISKVVIPDEFLLIEDVTNKATTGGIILPDSVKKQENNFKGKVIARGSKVDKELIPLGSFCFIVMDMNIPIFPHNGKEYGIVHRQNVRLIVKPDNYIGE